MALPDFTKQLGARIIIIKGATLFNIKGKKIK